MYITKRVYFVPPIKKEIQRSKWTWIGIILRKDATIVIRQALKRNPQGKLKTGDGKTVRGDPRPRN